MNDMQPGDVLDQAAQLLATHGNCANFFQDEITGQYCAWGVINQVTTGHPMPSFGTFDGNQKEWEALYDQLPEGYAERLFAEHPEFRGFLNEIGWGTKRRMVVNFNNENPGQPVIDLFEKAAANLGHQ
jgi:hypothetical protein